MHAMPKSIIIFFFLSPLPFIFSNPSRVQSFAMEIQMYRIDERNSILSFSFHWLQRECRVTYSDIEM